MTFARLPLGPTHIVSQEMRYVDMVVLTLVLRYLEGGKVSLYLVIVLQGARGVMSTP